VVAGVVVTALVAIAGFGVMDDPGSGAAVPKRSREPASGRATPPRVRRVATLWTATLADEPQALVTDGAGAVVIGNRSVGALELADGHERWRTPLEAVNPWAAADAERVVASTASAFVGLDRADGRVLWTVATQETPGPVALGAGVGVVTTREGGLVALDAADGTVRWSLRLPAPVRGAPVVDAATGAVVVVTGGASPRLRVLDAAIGTPRWDREIALQTGTPAVAVDAVVVGAGDGRGRSTVAAYAPADGAPRWSTAVPASFQPGLEPTIVDGDVYVVDQLAHVTRVDLRTGERRWSRDLGGAVLVGEPVVVGRAVVVTDALRRVTTLDRSTGRVVARRAATGVPVGVAAAGDAVLVVQRLVERDHVSAYAAAAVGAPRSRG
jgi:outer membrane protein assembly factor BamB